MKTDINRLIEAVRRLIDAFGGDVPDWIRAEVSALQHVIDEVQS